MLEGSGRTYIVPDQYYKAGQSNATLASYNPFQKHPFETTPGETVNVRQYHVPYKHYETIDLQEEGHIKEDLNTRNVE